MTAGELAEHFDVSKPTMSAHFTILREADLIEMERDGWIMVAAQTPHTIESMMLRKHQDLDDPDMVLFYRLISDALDWSVDDPRVVDVADVLERLMIRALEAGEVGADGFYDQFVDLLDATTANSSPIAKRFLAILEERGWTGWTRIERTPADAPDH